MGRVWNESTIGTFVFEYLDVNMPPIYLVVKSPYNSSYTGMLVIYNGYDLIFYECLYKCENQECFLKKQNDFWLE